MENGSRVKGENEAGKRKEETRSGGTVNELMKGNKEWGNS